MEGAGVSPDRVATVRRIFELWSEGVDDVPTDLISPEIELVSPLTGLRGRPYRGYADARQWLVDIREQFERWDYEIAEVREVADFVVAFGEVHLEGRTSGVSLDQRVAWLAAFAADGRIARMEVFTEPDEALRAALEA
jgi:ketosteroid isomerase-like protein